VIVVDENGVQVENVFVSALALIGNSIVAMGQAMGDGDGNEGNFKAITYQNSRRPLQWERDGPKYDQSKMLYYELYGGNFCRPKCYGYIVNVGPSLIMRLGALITQGSPNKYSLVLLPFPHKQDIIAERYKPLLEEGYRRFFREFEPIRKWVIEMARDRACWTMPSNSNPTILEFLPNAIRKEAQMRIPFITDQHVH